MKEIEYKFLVDEVAWNSVLKSEPSEIVQGYLSTDPNCTVRVRIKNSKAFLTIKGKSNGISRSEFEYEIPKEEAEELLKEMTTKVIQKRRYCIDFEDRTWEVDVFEGALHGLILAELEVESEDEQFNLPSWVKKDVSLDPEYYNSRLIERC